MTTEERILKSAAEGVPIRAQGQLCGARNISVWTPFTAELKFPNLHANRTYRRQHRIDEIAESARVISPRAAHRSGRDTLASSGSCHRMKAAAFH